MCVPQGSKRQRAQPNRGMMAPCAPSASRARSPPRGVTLHILRAMRSDRWDRETLAVVQGAVAATAQPAAVRGQTRYHELPDAGHWVSWWPDGWLEACT